MKLFLSMLIGILCTLSKSWGLVGVQAVNIVTDTGQPSRMAAMAKQLAEATKQLNEARKLVRTANTMVQIAGDPKSVIHSMRDLSSAARQLDQIFGTPTTRDFRKLVNAHDSLTRSQQYFDKEVKNSFLSGKKQKPRKANLYRVYALAESGYDSFENLVAVDKSIQIKEAKRQERLISDLTRAKTQSEVDRINASIAASKAAQDASSHQVAKHKMEVDIQKMAIETEQEKIQMACNEERFEELCEAQERLSAREEMLREQFNERVSDTRFVPYGCNVI